MKNLFRFMEPLYESVDLGGGGGGGGEESTSDVITSAINEAGGIEAGGSEGVVAPPPPVKQPTPEELSEEEELSKLEKEILAKNPTMANGKIAVHRHQAVLTRHRNQVEKEKQEWAKKQAEYDKQVADWKRYEWAKDPQLHEALQALALAETDQKKFVEYLLTDPRFAELIDFKQPQGQQTQKPVGGERPGPNVPDGQGGFYYDEKGLEALLAWERQQTISEAQKAFEKEHNKFVGDFKPIQEEYQARNAWNKALSEQKVVLEKMRAEWPGFKENEPKIKKAMMDNPTWSEHDAYRSVVVPSLQQQAKVDREKVRQELIAEMNAKRGAVVVQKPGRSPERETVPNTELSTADIIRQELARSQR